MFERRSLCASIGLVLSQKSKRSRILPVLFILFLCLILSNCTSGNWSSNSKHTEKQTVEPSPTTKIPMAQRAAERQAYEFEITKDPALNRIPRERLKIAIDYTNRMLARRAALPINWEERGPNNVGGRTRAVIFDLGDPSFTTAWAGGVAGGLWKTTNIYSTTPNWTKINDFFDNMAITSIAQDPIDTDTMYFGTGEGFFNSDAVRGDGIWKSVDGGSTWTQLASTTGLDFDYVNKIVVNEDGYIFAATRSTWSSRGGIMRSTDGGTTWTRFDGSNSLDWAADVELASNGDLYASFGLNYSDGIYKSENDGDSWTIVFDAASNEERIELACAPSNSDVVIALVENATANGVPQIYLTTDGGDNWDAVTTPDWYDQICFFASSDWTRSQDWYDLIAIFDPSDEDVIFIGGVDLFKTSDQGDSWTQISSWWGACGRDYVHADQHAMAVSPADENDLLFGNDGGVSLTTNAGSSFNDRNDDYNVTQFYACAVHPNKYSNYYLAGTQDNGTQKFTNPGINSTIEATGGDGGFCHIDQDNPNIQITSYVYNNYFISTNGGSSFSSRSFGNTGSFINPTDYDDDENKLYGGRSGGNFLRWNNPASAGSDNDVVTVSNFSGSSVRSVRVSPNVEDRVYFGLSNGNIVYVDGANGGTSHSGVLIRSGIGSVSCVEIEKGNEDHILYTVSNYGVTSIYESFDGGTTWTDVEGNLPDIPVRWCIFNPNNPNQAMIATEVGVWSTDNLNGNSTSWFPTNTGLANVRTDMLQYRSSDYNLAAATHGRGLFTTNDFNLGFKVTVDDNLQISDCFESVEFTINVDSTTNFTNAVELGTTGLPAGISASFNSTTLSPNSSTILTIDDLYTVDTGTLLFYVFGEYGGDTSYYAMKIYISPDVTPPTATCNDLTVYLDEDGVVVIDSSDVHNSSSDNCALVGYSIANDTLFCEDVGSTSVELTVLDSAGNEGNCTSTVQVIDTFSPNANCQDITLFLDENGSRNLIPATLNNGSTDNCSLIFTASVNTFNCDNIGLNNVKLYANDGSQIDSCDAQVTVMDTIPPNPICPDITLYLDSNGNLEIDPNSLAGNSTDACGVDTIILDSSNFNCQNIGELTLSLVLEDINQNIDSCMSTISIQDSIRPNATCKSDTLYLDGSGNATLIPTNLDQGSSDECGILSFSIDSSDFDCSELGLQVVKLTVQDSNGNMQSCNSNVQIVDTLPPIAICKDLTITLDPNGEKTVLGSEVNNGSSDNCSISSFLLDIMFFNCDDIGQNMVVLTTTDLGNNTDTCTAEILVEAGVLPVAFCNDITVHLDQDGMATITPDDVDNGSSISCGIVSLSIDSSDFNCTEIGLNLVKLTVVDQNQNKDSCFSSVTVLDTVIPEVQCLDITIELDDSGEVSITPDSVNQGSNDACGIEVLSIDSSHFKCINVGSNLVILSAMDSSGNENSCSATVTVLDTTAPTSMCMDDSLQLDTFNTATLSPSDIDNGSFDNCGITEFSLSDTIFNELDTGINVVVLTTFDGIGNSDTCHAEVLVIPFPHPVCVDTLYIGSMMLSGTYSATKVIITNGVALVTDSTTFSAPEVILNPGFDVLPGVYFQIINDPCLE